MDPIFMDAHDPKLYWKSHYLALDQATAHTYAGAPGSTAVREDTHAVLARDFQASFVLLEHGRNPSLIAYLTTAPGFVKAFETAHEVVFRVSPR
jgi:hypothetical protein